MSLLQNLISKPRKVFLLDGFGALLSAILLAIVIAPNETLFGVPLITANGLAIPAICFTIYSLGCYTLNPKSWATYLLIIATANLLYCCLTIYILFSQSLSTTLLGKAYFMIEIVTILCVVAIELLTVNENRKIQTE